MTPSIVANQGLASSELSLWALFWNAHWIVQGVMRPDGSGERILTDGYHNEGPTWAPNGRVVMFFRDPGGSAGPSLFTVDVTGRNEQRVPSPSYASDPAWSPLLR